MALSGLCVCMRWGGGCCGLCPGSGARLPGFILLVSLSGILLVVSILGMVYDCHLGPLLQSWGGGVLMVPVGRMGLCWPGIALSVVWGAGGGVGLWSVYKVESSARARLAFRGLSCW